MKLELVLQKLGLIQPGKIMYIGGSDVLPAPLRPEDERRAIEALAAGDLVAIPLQCDWPRRQIYLLEDTARPLNRWAEPLRQSLLESAQA